MHLGNEAVKSCRMLTYIHHIIYMKQHNKHTCIQAQLHTHSRWRKLHARLTGFQHSLEFATLLHSVAPQWLFSRINTRVCPAVLQSVAMLQLISKCVTIHVYVRFYCIGAIQHAYNINKYLNDRVAIEENQFSGLSKHIKSTTLA